MADVIELSQFRVAESDESAFLASYPDLRSAMERFEGMKSVRLAKREDGAYVFIAVWEKREQCERAMEQSKDDPAISKFLSYVEEDLGMAFAEAVEAA